MKDITALIEESLDDSTHMEEARVFAQGEYEQFYNIRPFLTFYRPGEPIMSIKFPFAETPDDRTETLRQASFCSAFFPTVFFRLFIDSFVPLKDSEDVIDAILMVRFNTKSCEYKVLPYTVDNVALNWLDPAVVAEGDLLEDKIEILTFAALNSFHESLELTWGSYKKFLESRGFEFSFHGSYNETALSYYARGLI